MTLFTSPTFQHAENAFRRAACVYALGGCVHAATSAGLLFLFGIYSLPYTLAVNNDGVLYRRVLVVVFDHSVALALFWGPDRRFRGAPHLGIRGMLPAVGVLLQLAGAPALPFTDVG